MKKTKREMGKLVAKAAYWSAKNNANQVCSYFFYQPELPNKVAKLKRK